MTEVRQFPIGAGARLEELEQDPHALLARLREQEPVSWLPVLDGWLVTRRDLAMQVMRDPETFTVDDPRFSTGQVVGSSMLTLDGEEHLRHREPFARPFRLAPVRERFTEVVAKETERLIDAVEPAGRAELRTSVTGPLAVAVVTYALGFDDADVGAVLGWYERIVAAVTDITAGLPLSDSGRAAYEALSTAIGPALDREPAASLLAAAASQAGGLERERVISNAAVMLFGGIETTDGMIANAVLHLLSHPDQLALVQADAGLVPNAIEESLRLEPAAAVIDRYATADVELAGAPIRRSELVRISIAGANRDPEVFPDPDRFDVRRENAHRHVAFAHGPHVCIGMHLARLEAHTAVERLLRRLPALRLDPAHPAEPRGLVFRKPPELHVLWTSIRFRRATVADAEPLARGVLEGIEDYPSFAPPGWTAPSLEAELEHLRESLADEDVCCLVADSGGDVIGQITLLPAARAPHPVDDASLAHISNLFVRRDHWGAGLAGDLHRAALEAARERGFTELRLFVAAGQARARRFYEREGWLLAGDPFDDPIPGLTMIEYRYGVGARRAGCG